MKIHHLNCGSMSPIGAPEGLVCHVLLIEADSRLILVDSGLGLRDLAEPARRFGPIRRFLRPALAEDETAIRQVERLGFDPTDVRDIVLTHFDGDHTGGLADFPWARVHLTEEEGAAALAPVTVVERGRYRPAHYEHGPRLIEHTLNHGDVWRGFSAVRELTDVAPGLVMLGLPGHTRGHAAVAVDADDHWVLHVGDAFYHHGQVDGTSRGPRSLRAMERLVAHDWTKVRANHDRLAALWRDGEPDLMVVNAHDPALLRRAQSPCPEPS